MAGERPTEPAPWLLVRRFADVTEARQAYEQTRDLILVDDLPASVFRFTIAADSFVAALGDSPLTSLAREQLEETLQEGQPAEVPGDVIDQLRSRRRRFNALPIEFLERRHQG
jgi:hypothetical protein